MAWSGSPTAKTLASSPREQAGQLDLRDVGVLELVDEDEARMPLRALQHRLAADQHIDGARHDVAEGAEAFLLQHVFRITKGARHFAAAAKYLIVGTWRRILRLAHARQRDLAALDLRDEGVVVAGRAQLVVTTAEELEQVVEELSRRGGLDVVLQLQVVDAAAEKDEEILVVEELELVARVVQQPVTVRMKGVRLQAAAQQLARALWGGRARDTASAAGRAADTGLRRRD